MKKKNSYLIIASVLLCIVIINMNNRDSGKKILNSNSSINLSVNPQVKSAISGCDRVCINPFSGKTQAEFTSLYWGCYINNATQKVEILSDSDKKNCDWHKHTHIIAIDGSDRTYNSYIGDYRKIIDNILFKYIHNNQHINSKSNPFLSNKNCVNLAFGDEVQVWRVEQGCFPIFQHVCEWISNYKDSKPFLWTTKSKKLMIDLAGEIIIDDLKNSLSKYSFMSSQLFPNPQNTDLVLSINDAIKYANTHQNEAVFFYLISPDLKHNPSNATNKIKAGSIPKNLLITWNMQDNPRYKGKVQNMENDFRNKVGLLNYEGQDFFTTFRGTDLNP
jgi:hypothetical protein